VSDYHLNKLLFDMAGRHAMVESIDDAAQLEAYDLTADEREALRRGDLERLHALGANPYLIRRVFRPRFAI
jgi:hypothetical protein